MLFKVVLKEIDLAHGIRLGTMDKIKSNQNRSFCRLAWRTFYPDSKDNFLSFKGKGLLLDFRLENFAMSIGTISLRNHERRKGPP